jgi:hypothetical protein
LAAEEREKKQASLLENNIRRVKAEVRAFDDDLRIKEEAALEKFHDEQRAALAQYARQTGAHTDLFEKEQEARFAKEKAELDEQQQKRWEASEQRIEHTMRNDRSVDPEYLIAQEKLKLLEQDLDRTNEERNRVAEQKAQDASDEVERKKEQQRAQLLADLERLLAEHALRIAQEEKRIADQLQAEQKKVAQDAAIKLELTEMVRQENFKQAEAKAWEEEQKLRERENEALRQREAFQKDGLNNRLAGEPEKLKEMQEKQEKILEQQRKEQQEWQEKRWAEEQQKLAELHQIRLEEEAERQRQEEERRRREAEQRAAQQRQLLY